jgi:hypothetical protein
MVQEIRPAQEKRSTMAQEGPVYEDTKAKA